VYLPDIQEGLQKESVFKRKGLLAHGECEKFRVQEESRLRGIKGIRPGA